MNPAIIQMLLKGFGINIPPETVSRIEEVVATIARIDPNEFVGKLETIVEFAKNTAANQERIAERTIETDAKLASIENMLLTISRKVLNNG